MLLGRGLSVEVSSLPPLTAEAFLERCDVLEEIASEERQRKAGEERRKSALRRAREVAGDEWK